MAKFIKVPFPDGTTMTLSQDAWDRFVADMEKPREPNDKLKELMRSDPPWEAGAKQR